MSHHRLVLLAAVLVVPGLLAGSPANVHAQPSTGTLGSTDLAVEAAAAASAATAAEADAVAAQTAADEASSTASTTQTEADAQGAAEAQAVADAALDTANAADTAAADAAAAVSASSFRLNELRAVQSSTNQQLHRLIATVDGDDDGKVTAVQVKFDETFGSPQPLEGAYTLLRTGTRYESTGSLQIADDGTGTPVWGEPYDLTFSLVDPNGVASTPFVLSGVPVGAFYKVSGPPAIFTGTAYALESIDWSRSPDCPGCPIISLVNVGFDSSDPTPAQAPLSVRVTGDPVSPILAFPIGLDHSRFATTGEFEDTTLAFDADALGLPYLVTGTMFAGDVPVGEPTQFRIEIEEDDAADPDPDPVPTLVIASDLSGSVMVEDGDYVILQAQVGRNVTVKGGTLVIEGGVVGRDLELEGGTVILADATIGRDLVAKGGSIEFGQAVIGRDLEIKGGVQMSGDEESLLAVGRDLTGRTTASVTLGGNLDVQHQVRLRLGYLSVKNNIRANDVIDMRVRGNADGGMWIDGELTSRERDIDLRSDGAGGLNVDGAVTARGGVQMRADACCLVVNGPVVAETGRIEMRSDGDGGLWVTSVVTAEQGKIDVRVTGGGDLGIDGVVTAATDIDLRVRSGDGDLTIGGSVTAELGDVQLRVRKGHGGLVVNGSVVAAGDVDMRLGDGFAGGQINGRVVAGVDFRVRAEADFAVAGAVAAKEDIDIRLKGGGTATIAGTIAAELGSVELVSDGDLVLNGTVATIGPRATFGVSSIGISVRNVQMSGTVSSQGDVVIDAVDSELTGATVEAISGALQFRMRRARVTGHLSTSLTVGRLFAGTDIDIVATEQLDLVGGTVQADQGSVSLRGNGCTASYGVDDVSLSPIFMVVTAGTDVTIEATEQLDLVGVTVQADQGSVTLRGGSVASYGVDDVRIEPIPMVVSAGTDINIVSSVHMKLASGDFIWGDDGAFSWTVDPTAPVIVNGAGSAEFSSVTGNVVIMDSTGPVSCVSGIDGSTGC